MSTPTPQVWNVATRHTVVIDGSLENGRLECDGHNSDDCWVIANDRGLWRFGRITGPADCEPSVEGLVRCPPRTGWAACCWDCETIGPVAANADLALAAAQLEGWQPIGDLLAPDMQCPECAVFRLPDPSDEDTA